jgi:hypothetical protein
LISVISIPFWDIVLSLWIGRAAASVAIRASLRFLFPPRH